MLTGNTKYWLGVFFCTVGCVCNSSAMGANGVGGVAPGEPIPPDGTIPALFDAETDTDEQLPQGQQVEVGSFGQIDLHVKDLDLTKVLQLLSIQSQRNIIASRNVAGTVSADLYGVDFYEALDAILSTNGFGYREKGQFIYVYTAEEIAQLDDENRDLVYQVVRLDYINAADASAFASPLLSGSGSIALSGEAEGGFQPSISDGGANSSAHQDTLIIRDYAENVEEITDLIKDLDTRPKQVLVEATILQARLTEANAFGIDFAIFADLNLADFTTPLGAVDELITGGVGDSGSAVTTSPGNVAQGASSVKFGVVGSDAALFVRALDSVTDTTVLAKPQVLVLNRQKVDLLVGERLGYLSTTATETSNTQTVEFLDVGTQLSLRPFISSDDFVRMELRPSVSDGSTSLVGGQIIPNTSTQELVSNVIVKSGQTVVLGGLFKEDTTIGRTQVPGVGSLPIIGPAFKGQDDTVNRSEVIFMIKPTVQKDEDLTQMADNVSADVEATRIGARNGLLPWSRTKLTSKYITDAMAAMKAGNNEKALFALDKALYLDPTMADALQLKAQITGEKNYFYDRSILKNAVDAEINAEISVNADETPAEDLIGDALNTDADAGWTEPAAESDWSEPSADAQDTATESTIEFVEPATDWEQAGADEPSDASFEIIDVQADPASDSEAWNEEAPSDEQAEAAEEPWQVEINTEDGTQWESAEVDEFGEIDGLPDGSESMDGEEVAEYEPVEYFTEPEADNEPVNIFEFVEQTLGTDEETADADTEEVDSEAAVTSVDTEEVNE